MTLLDDTYDAYGTFEELKQFTNAVERWDAVDLPEYLTFVFRALANLHEELEVPLAAQGRSYCVDRLRQRFKYLASAYELEIRWVEDGYAPTMEEYFANRIVTSMGTLLLASFVGMGEFAKVDAFDWLQANPRIAVASAILGRLFNDLASSEGEREREHIAGALECYMKEFSLSKQDAIDEIYRRIDDGWKDINEEILRPTTVSMHLLMRILNLTRSVNVLYKDGEAFTHQEILKDDLELLFSNAIPV
ncbi:Valencene synthase [Bertholletia excelsa]